ncbi:MAG: hypothetical protein WAO98_07895 [Alphaproteobacteria bacterium]
MQVRTFKILLLAFFVITISGCGNPYKWPKLNNADANPYFFHSIGVKDVTGGERDLFGLVGKGWDTDYKQRIEAALSARGYLTDNENPKYSLMVKQTNEAHGAAWDERTEKLDVTYTLFLTSNNSKVFEKTVHTEEKKPALESANILGDFLTGASSTKHRAQMMHSNVSSSNILEFLKALDAYKLRY